MQIQVIRVPRRQDEKDTIGRKPKATVDPRDYTITTKCIASRFNYMKKVEPKTKTHSISG